MIAAGVFLGIFGYEKFTEYRLQKQMENIQAEQKQRQQQMAAQLEQQRKVDIYKNTACAINEDKDTCVCMNEKTGARISIARAECVKRAREITW